MVGQIENEPRNQEPAAVVNRTEARQGEATGYVRRILTWGIILVSVGFVLVYLFA